MLPYLKTIAASRRDIENFTGLNRTDSAGDGVLTDAVNMSSRRYPCLAPRMGRADVELGIQRGKALFAWDELVWVDGTTLYTIVADEQGNTKPIAVGTVTEGEKQFAVVNSKLVIWPDKLMLDLNNRTLKKMEASMSAALGTASFTTDTLTIDSTDPVLSTPTESFPYDSDSPQMVLKYDSLSWENGAWVKGAESEVSIADLKAGDLLIPGAANTMRIKGADGYAAENASGNYLKVKSASKTGTTEGKWEKWESEIHYYSYDRTRYKDGTWTHYGASKVAAPYSMSGYAGYSLNPSTGQYTLVSPTTVTNNGSVYTAGGSSVTGFILQQSGDEVIVTPATMSAVSYTETVTGSSYVKGSVKVGDVYADVGTYPTNGRHSDGYWYVYVGETGFEGTVSVTYEVYGVGNPKLTSQFNVGDRVTISGTANNNVVRAQVLEIGDYTMKFPANTFTAGAEAGTVTISREIPDLDFICASNNRLWGVCNKDTTTMWDAETQSYKEVTARSIWASALGLPERFYDYDGLSTDSYAVAVGSPGNFTGIIDYSGAVLCWKEDTLHRMAGDYPANYVMYTDSYVGLQAGSHKSMVIINEILYYKGRDGVYAFSGGQPQLLSYRLGETRYEAAVAGERAGRYYISMRNKDSGAHELLTYDTIRDCWYAEDDLEVYDFAELRGTLYALSSDGKVYAMGEGNVDDVEWSATLAEWNEGTYEYKHYRRVHVDVDVKKGAVMEVDVTVDNMRERFAWRSKREGRQRIDIPLRNYRAQRVIVRLSGTGDVVIRRVTREVTLRG